jgi:hypothetical protein
LYIAWLATAVWLFADLGLWNLGLLKPTIVWALFSGIGLFFGISKALRQETFWREALAATVGATVFAEFYINLVSFPLLVELVLQPILILTILASALAALRPNGDSVEKANNWIFMTVGLVGFAWVLWSVVERWDEVDVSQLLLEVFVPIWLTPIALAFVYVLALYAGYEQAFKRISWRSPHSSWRRKVAYASLVGVQLRNLRRFDGGAQLAAEGESTLRGARTAMTAEVQRRREMLEPRIEPPAIDVDQVQWSIITSDGRVTLKGDLPNGYPTETWIDERLWEREPDGVFSWDLDTGLPTPVSLISKHTDCSEVRREIDLWDGLTSTASTPIGAVRTRAYAQAARDRASALGC